MEEEKKQVNEAAPDSNNNEGKHHLGWIIEHYIAEITYY